MTTSKPDPEIGDEYQDKYKGEVNRTVKVLEPAEPDGKGRPRFRVETITNDRSPDRIGTSSIISLHTLQQSFRKLEP